MGGSNGKEGPIGPTGPAGPAGNDGNNSNDQQFILGGNMALRNDEDEDGLSAILSINPAGLAPAGASPAGASPAGASPAGGVTPYSLVNVGSAIQAKYFKSIQAPSDTIGGMWTQPVQFRLVDAAAVGGAFTCLDSSDSAVSSTTTYLSGNGSTVTSPAPTSQHNLITKHIRVLDTPDKCLIYTNSTVDNPSKYSFGTCSADDKNQMFVWSEYGLTPIGSPTKPLILTPAGSDGPTSSTAVGGEPAAPLPPRAVTLPFRFGTNTMHPAVVRPRVIQAIPPRNTMIVMKPI